MEKIKARIIALLFNEVDDPDTNYLVNYSLEAINEYTERLKDYVEIETAIVDLAGTNIRMCLGCDKRWELAGSGRPWGTDGLPEGYKGCVIRNDWIAKEWWPKLNEGQGYIMSQRVANFCATLKMRFFKERGGAAGALYKWPEGTVNAPVNVITVGHSPQNGQESAAINVSGIAKGGEFIPVSWMFGVQATGDPRNDVNVKRLAVLNARRLVEAVMVNRLARMELGEVYLKQFIQMYHAPHPEGPWAWYRLDKEEEERMLSK